MSLFTRFFGEPENTANSAKERLQLVLAHDRMSIPPATLNALRDEIISAISRHVEIDRNNVDVQVTRTKEGSRLVMNMPVLGVRSVAIRPRRRLRRAR